MKNKQIDILKTKGKEAFRTPEGYFDTFTERLMSQIPEEDVNKVGDASASVMMDTSLRQKSLFERHSLVWTSAAAACIAVLITLTTLTYVNYGSAGNEVAEAETEDQTYDAYDDEFMQYQVDCCDVYDYLAGVNY